MANPSQNISEQVKRQMNQPQIHDAWERNYRSRENEQFFEQAYDDFVVRLAQPPGSRALDIGCGICANSLRLARRGYVVSAADYSEPILVQARKNVAKQGLSDRITIGREDILNLSFPNDHFDLVLCWGVLMHIPEAQRAINELIRVTKPSGFIVLEEINQNAPEALLMRLAWSALKKNVTISNTPRGYEQTSRFEGETLFWRHVNPDWLISQFEGCTCRLFRRDSSLLSETYIYIPSMFAKSAIHRLNRLWLRRVNLPRLAFHNVFIFRKNEPLEAVAKFAVRRAAIEQTPWPLSDRACRSLR
jgi:2-polyprenyl-3-methyl-5-hydroxy-6-metoxy-1,4-benzoquinol methylase